MHPQVVSRAHRLLLLGIIEHVKHKSGVRFTTMVDCRGKKVGDGIGVRDDRR